MAAAIADIADALDQPPPPYDGDRLLEMGLAGGNVGYALFHAYLDRVAPTARLKRVGQRHLRAGLKRIPAGSNRPFFSYGFSGAGWTFQHLGGWFSDIGTDVLDDIDEALTMIVEQAQTVTYDMQYGMVGFGTYALERLPRPGARKLLEAIVRRLSRTAERGTVGLTWRCVNAVWIESPMLAALERGLYWSPVYNGVAGIAGLLGGVVAAGIARREAKRLL